MNQSVNRRRLLIGSAGLIGLAAFSPGRQVWSAEFLRTPRQTEGPFYPLVRPATADNDLIHVPGQSGVAAGEVATVSGRVLDIDGRPLSGVLVEIWQANGHGRYNDLRDASDKPMDPRFKGYGTFLTGDDGAYKFHTIKPVAYPGRTPHIHFALSGKSTPRLVTQMYVAGEPGNDRDGVLRGLTPAERARLVVALEKTTGNEWRANFDIVLERRNA